MSKATKRKHVVKEVEQNLDLPTPLQSIVQIKESRGNNLHEVKDSNGESYLVSMPTKFRRNIWVKRKDFVLVEPILEGDKVKAEIVKILTREHIKWYRSQKCWPIEFDDSDNRDKKCLNGDKNLNESDKEDDGDLFVNTNRIPTHCYTADSDTDNSSG
ncbi:probable RNA-binding protein EIF1AD [Prorops nasuta]|uniref:probable RNA-binding protein EIF1AD n=1 Tax=Prorops nasuta TaxID=863751 RepID=UPI0034CDD779